MINHLPWRKLSFRLIAIMSVLMLTTFLAVGVTLSKYLSERQIETLRTEANLKSKAISKDISANFTMTRTIVKQMTFNRGISTYLSEVDTREKILTHPLYPEVLETLKDIASSNAVFNIAWVANDLASFYTENSGFVSDSDYIITKRPWYEEAVSAREVSFSKPYIDYGTKKLIISCIAPIDFQGTGLGFCSIDLVIDTIPEYMKTYRIGASGENMLLMSDGTYIYSDDKSKIMNMTIRQETSGLESLADEILNKEEGFEEVIYKGRPSYVSYQNISENGWIVVSLIDKEEALLEKRMLEIRIYALLIGVAFLILIAIYIVISRITKPFSLITDHARIISEGDFSKNLPTEYLLKNGEMGDLSRSVQMITQAFRDENEVLEKRIEEKNKALEEQYRYISEAERLFSLRILVSGIAHEINTPLGVAITSYSYLKNINSDIQVQVADASVSKAQFLDFIKNVNQSVEILGSNLSRVAELIDRFKLVAVHEQSDTLATFDLKEYIELIFESLKGEVRDLVVEFDLSCDEGLILNSYPGTYSQIFTNLIMNAFNHAFKGRNLGRIEVKCSLKGNRLFIDFEDDGVGMAAEHLKRIFDPFFTTDYEGKSSGLGMHIVYNLVTQKLNGSIRVESALGEGTKIHIEVDELTETLARN